MSIPFSIIYVELCPNFEVCIAGQNEHGEQDSRFVPFKSRAKAVEFLEDNGIKYFIDHTKKNFKPIERAPIPSTSVQTSVEQIIDNTDYNPKDGSNLNSLIQKVKDGMKKEQEVQYKTSSTAEFFAGDQVYQKQGRPKIVPFTGKEQTVADQKERDFSNIRKPDPPKQPIPHNKSVYVPPSMRQKERNWSSMSRD